MAWLQANWLYVFTAWCALNAVLSPLAANVPTTTWYGKALHTFVAISPMDVMKAIKAVGASLAVPIAGATLCLLVAVLPGCSLFSTSSSTPQTAAQTDAQARALADGATTLLETAWEASANACLAAANAQHNDTIRQKCEPPLTTARNALLAAQSAIDVWDSASQSNFPCLIASVTSGLAAVEKLDPAITLPQVVTDALTLAQTYAGKCTLTDAGTP
jgi:hypothetical protein